MSIDTDPSLYNYSVPPAPVCNLCYTPNKTPDQIFVSLSAVQIGALWAGPDPPPPNDVFQLDIIAACRWSSVIGPFTFFYSKIGDLFALTVNIAGPTFVFSSGNIQACTTWFANGLDAPAGNHYYGGWAVVTHMMPDEQISIQEIMGLVNLVPEANTFAKPIPQDNQFTFHRFSRREGMTNIHIKMEDS